MRGKGPAMSPGHITCGITPACAGKRHCKRFSQLVYWDHPRMCGEKKSFANSIEMELGSPPHVRGKGGFRPSSYLLFRITPACAGKSLWRFPWRFFLQDHPRMCGEKIFSLLYSASDAGSPPHVRGKADVLDFLQFGFGITPACAGKRQNTGCKAVNQRDHPRMCGEKASFVLVVWSRAGSPPHVRGKGAGFTFVPLILRITPACAGKRRCKAASVWLYWDHPRMCGEKWF